MQFYRQRIIVEFLRKAKRPVGRMELTKWAFLLKSETTTRGGDAFYEFLPYKFGPFSFGLNRDAEELARTNCLVASDKEWTALPSSDTINLPEDIAKDLDGIVLRYGGLPLKALLNHVYTTYKPYTVNSEIRKLAPRPTAYPAIHTIGYEGRHLDGLLDALIQSGIRHLIDVRRNPISRRFGFHKSTLARHCALVGIEYSHRPELGIASEERSHLSATRDYAELFDRYERETLPRQQADVEAVAADMRKTPGAIMCMERKACECHRKRLANRLAEVTGLPVVHLP